MTRELGVKSADGPYQYLAGPFVLPFVERGGEAAVIGSPPWEAEWSEVCVINGDSFQGQFFVETGWYLEGKGEKCLCSGFFPNEGKPLEVGWTTLPSGGDLSARHAVPQVIWLPLEVGQDVARQQRAVREAREAYGANLDVQE